MKSQIRETLFLNWHLRRWIALIAGSFFLLQAFWHWDVLSGLLGGFFLFQAVTNSGCLVSRGCAAPAQASSESDLTQIEDIEFTEIKES